MCVHICDYISGLRCYSTDFAKEIVNDLHSQTYETQIETIRQAGKQRFSVKLVSIVFVNRKREKPKLTPNEITGFISYIIKVTIKS